MALQSSGSISINNVAGEFGGSTPHSISEYYGSDYYHGVPASGSISLADFYSASIRTARLTVGAVARVSGGTISSTEHARYGYAASNKSNYWHFEGSSFSGGAPQTTGFGSATRTGSLISGGTFLGLQCIEYNTPQGGTSPLMAVELMTTRSTNGGWNNMHIKFPNVVVSVNRSQGTFGPQFGQYEAGSPDINGVYKWIFGNQSAGATYSFHSQALFSVPGSVQSAAFVVSQMQSAYSNGSYIYVLFD